MMTIHSGYFLVFHLMIIGRLSIRFVRTEAQYVKQVVENYKVCAK